jgi:hypothetical protein
MEYEEERESIMATEQVIIFCIFLGVEEERLGKEEEKRIGQV